MDKFLAPTKEDVKFALQREYRQQQEASRKKRIFNPRVRLIGVDKPALDQHVAENEHEKALRQQEEMCFALEQERLATVMNAHLSELTEEKWRTQRELNEFRQKHQRKEQSRDFDLNDPSPPGDGLEWLGEDPANLHRLQLQKQQQKSWLEQQIFEKNCRKNAMNKADKAIESHNLSKDAQEREEEWREKRQRQQWQMDTAQYNFKLAMAQRTKRMEEKRREEKDNLAEIMNNLSSDMLTESKDCGASSSLFGGKRVTAAMYRGMTEEELKQIRLEQLRQMEENNAKVAEMKGSDKRFDDMQKTQLIQFDLEEQEALRQKQQMLAEQNAANARLLMEQTERNRYFNDEVYKFTPTDEYYGQFNTTTR